MKVLLITEPFNISANDFGAKKSVLSKQGTHSNRTPCERYAAHVRYQSKLSEMQALRKFLIGDNIHGPKLTGSEFPIGNSLLP